MSQKSFALQDFWDIYTPLKLRATVCWDQYVPVLLCTWGLWDICVPKPAGCIDRRRFEKVKEGRRLEVNNVCEGEVIRKFISSARWSIHPFLILTHCWRGYTQVPILYRSLWRSACIWVQCCGTCPWAISMTASILGWTNCSKSPESSWYDIQCIMYTCTISHQWLTVTRPTPCSALELIVITTSRDKRCRACTRTISQWWLESHPPLITQVSCSQLSHQALTNAP